MSTVRIVNFAEISDPEWTFLEKKIRARDTSWSFFSSNPKYWIERVVRRPNLARLRASLHAGYCARRTGADLIISHLPRATLWVAIFSKLFRSQARHIAFSFNFTGLPTGINRGLMRYAFRGVDRFVVFSEAERDLYASFFGLALDRFDVMRWCMDRPNAITLATDLPAKYICAVGGEGRDYKSLLSASRLLPEIPIVIVARPSSLMGLEVPHHVHVFIDLKNEEFWGVVKNSSFLVLPLKDASTNCGHISIVGSQLFGKPIVSTYSSGTSEYLQHGHNALMGTTGDSQQLGMNIKKMWEDQFLYEKLQINIANDGFKHSTENWVAYFDSYLQSMGSAPRTANVLCCALNQNSDGNDASA